MPKRTFWWQVELSGYSNAEAIQSALFKLGSRGTQDLSDHVIAYFESEDFKSSKGIVGSLGKALGPRIKITVHKLPAQDWESGWKKYFKPRRISKRVVVRPSWEKYKKKKKEIVVVIDPKMSFGTGTHETTQLVLKSMEKILRKKEVVMDIGTGTGILAIAAAKLGAGKVFALDNDEDSFINAKENVAVNKAAGKIKIAHTTLDRLPKRWPKKVDLMLANIQRSIIEPMLKTMKEHLRAQGRIILSGLLVEEDAQVFTMIERSGLIVKKSFRDGEWMCYIVKKA